MNKAAWRQDQGGGGAARGWYHVNEAQQQSPRYLAIYRYHSQSTEPSATGQFFATPDIVVSNSE